MNTDIMRSKAIEILLCQQDNLEERIIPEQKAVYYRNINRGGGALIMSSDGSVLFVDPFFVAFDEHLQKFINGERSFFE